MFSADLGGAAPASAPATNDPPFQKVALLLHGDGTNGAQNNTFVDSSSNNFTITRTGNVAQGTFSPFSLAEGQWSNYFSGTTATQNSLTSTVTALNTDVFTVEFWHYFSGSTGSDQQIVDLGANGFSIYYSQTNDKINVFNRVGGYDIFSFSLFTKNAWNHIAFVREGAGTNQTKLYINGTQAATATVSTNFTSTSVTIGGRFTVFSSNWYTSLGYISNVRVVKGTAVYTSNFTPSTTPLTAISGTSLLTCQSNRFKDNSSNNFTITRNGDTKVTAFSPFAPSAAYSASTNGGSGYFDGSGDYLTVPANTGFDFGSSNSTVEAWVYLTRQTNSGTQGIISKGASGSTGSDCWSVEVNTSGYLRCVYGNGGVALIVDSALFQINSWVHVAMVCSSSTVTLYKNGVSVGSATASASISAGGPVTIGSQWYTPSDTIRQLQGYISNSRVISGTAVYTSNFTPPTAPLTAVANTQLLLNFTNAGIIDNSGKNDIETVGNAQISTSVKKYGTGSMYFDGSGDYLKAPTDALFGFGSGDFTIEAWVYPLTTGTDRAITDFRVSAVANGTFFINTTEKLTWWNGSTSIGGTGTSLTTNSWNHVALSRASGTTRAFLNGVQQWSSTSLGTQPLTAPLGVGAAPYDGSSLFNGYLDDIRITKGQALYTSNFTPPTQAFPDV